MWYQVKNIEDKIKHRATLQLCSRCGFYYKKSEPICHHCNNMDDEAVLRHLARKKYFRVSLGKIMFLAALIILMLMLML